MKEELMQKPQFRQPEIFLFTDKDSNIVRLDSVLPVQTLRNFPIEKLYGEVVMVRLDSGLLLNLRDSDDLSLNRALLTINYLYNAGAKVILVSNWLQSNASRLLSKEAFADHLSALLKVKVVPANDASAIMQFKMKNVENADVLLLDNLTNDKEEVANSYEFSKTLSSGVSIFVNDAFSLSHRVLASTVGVARFCHASVAGFHFEEELLQLMKISETKKQPYVAIKDFLCVKVGKPELLEIYTYNEILAGWMPVDLGPVSMKETSSMLSTCKLVQRCLDNLHQSELKNGYFISTNATSTFRSIVSSYPGDLVLVTIQVFLQSDIETVTTRMKHLFITYGKGKLVVDGDARDWMEENPFGVRTDWEQHVIERGAPMYRIVLKKV
ncbi:phosphoglycerate kinase [Musa troglodytarum]|uniref:Phosphoglycerate kinase n=1 Tax=Musa troglodytarum TaxID=320322 RepID=A0A9E7KXB4_9LILI|nr:phosphoglycerate kinase [Musa troglodytarum]